MIVSDSEIFKKQIEQQTEIWKKMTWIKTYSASDIQSFTRILLCIFLLGLKAIFTISFICGWLILSSTLVFSFFDFPFSLDCKPLPLNSPHLTFQGKIVHAVHGMLSDYVSGIRFAGYRLRTWKLAIKQLESSCYLFFLCFCISWKFKARCS